MLEKYEQKKLVEYLLEGLSKISTQILRRQGTRSFEDVVEALINAIEDGRIDIDFDYDVSDINNPQLTSQNAFFKDKKRSQSSLQYNMKILKMVKAQLRNANKSLKNVKPSQKEKCFRVIQEIFNLSNEEINILALIARKTLSETFSDCLCIPRNDYGSDNERRVCKLYLKNSATIYDSLEELEKYGLLICSGHMGYNYRIPDFLEGIFNHNLKISRAEIIEKVMGQRGVATLKKSDFAHIKKEFDMVRLILKNTLQNNTKGVNILLYGEVGTGKTEFAKTLAKCLKLPLYETLYENNSKEEVNRRGRLYDLMRKVAICKNIESKQLILFDEAEDVFNDTPFHQNTQSKAFVNKMLENNEVPIIWTTNNIRTMDKAYLRRFTYSVKFEELSDEVQLKFMKKEFAKNKFEMSDDEVLQLSKKYDLSSSVITNSIMLTKLTNSDKNKFEDFVKNHTVLLNHGKEKPENFNANKKTDSYNFDLVNTDTDVHKLTDSIKNTGKSNFSLCLYGEAGTGKSEYAKQLADRLGFEVIFKRASDLISKWVGETEQNIARAFKEARDKKAVLIFDEADSLLQSRGNAQRSWEISQVNEMLTWMESHPYPFICTTNFMDTLDEASLRRFTFKIKFKYMNTEQVKLGFKHFFDKEVDEEVANIKGLTAGDFATVKKKISFLGTDDVFELKQMLEDEVKVKKSKELSTNVGF